MDAWDALPPLRRCGARGSAPESPALILFTSGTTGKPKGVVLRHRSIVNNARLSTARIAPPPASVWLNVLPMFHVGGSVTMTLGCLSNLGTQVMLPEFAADAMLDALRRYDVAINNGGADDAARDVPERAFSGRRLSGVGSDRHRRYRDRTGAGARGGQALRRGK